jgi:ATP-binding cassette subfamily C protein
MEVIRTLFNLLTARERRNLYFLFVAVLMMAGMQVVSVASIMPFLSVASDPSSVQESEYLSWAFHAFGFNDPHTFLIALGLGALAMLVVSNSFILLTNWVTYHYAWKRNHSLSHRLLKSYLNCTYEYFLTRNTAELRKNILEEVKEVVMGIIRPGLRGMAKAIMAFFIVGFLVFIDPVVALIVATVLGSSYVGIYFAIRNRIDAYGKKRVRENTKRYQYVSEALGGIKEVKLRGKEKTFLDQYDEPSEKYSWYQAQYRFIKGVPRYVLEAIAFGGIILIAVYLIGVQGSVRQVIPMLGLYAFAGYRLMPALQQAFVAVANMRYNLAALKMLSENLQSSEDTRSAPQVSPNGKDGELNELQDQLVLQDIHYTYPGAEKSAISGLSLKVPARTTVGFVGKTGSGKTTTIDLILGLLRPQSGVISVDGIPLSDGVLSDWQQDIGYVPQQIYLSDDTIARNIAFGVPREQIDMDAVRDAARRAHIYDFVANELPKQWSTTVGEQGVKLSGGQRQRIGIARALYHNPSVLVFDEATSALDQATEASVMQAIYELEDDHTMLMIAHRLSTVKRADNIVMLEQGRKVAEGTYKELSSKSSKFKSMALS